MSLADIQNSIEKTALAAGLGNVLSRAAKSPAAWKAVGKRSAIGAGIGAAGNVAIGDKDQSIMERATKGAIGGGLVGGLYGAGRIAYKANKGLTTANRAATDNLTKIKDAIPHIGQNPVAKPAKVLGVR